MADGSPTGDACGALDFRQGVARSALTGSRVRSRVGSYPWLGLRPAEGEGLSMDISVSDEVQEQLDQVKEWMESKIGRDVTYNDVIMQLLKNFQSVLYPEDLGSA